MSKRKYSESPHGQQAKSDRLAGECRVYKIGSGEDISTQAKRKKKRAKGRKYHGDNTRQYNRKIKAAPKSEHKIYKGELRMKELLDKFFPDVAYINNHRPQWLVNPKTSALLELDRYYPELKLAFEFQGDQHYRFIAKYHGSKAGFNRQVERDRLKRKQCQEQGVFLCYVHANDLLDYGMDSVIDGLERAKGAGKNWSGQRKVEQICVNRPRRQRKKNSKKLRAARRSGVIGSNT